MKIQDMSLTPDRQGYLGDLADRSVAQLKELLDRQEKLLLKRKFLEHLPDKGEKNRTFAAHLKQLIEQKSNDLTRTSTFTESVTAVPKLQQRSNLAENVRVSNSGDITIDEDIAEVPVARNDASGRIISSGDSSAALSNITPTEMMDSSSSILLGLEKMSLGGSSQKILQDTSHYINSYERVIKNKEPPPLNLRPKFMPHRSLLDNHIPASPYPHKTEPKKVEREELSAVNLPCYKFQSTKLISVEESVQLIEHQMILNEELVTQRAAQKLADQLIPKMDVYSPDSTDMRYRDTAEADRDSDDDDDSQDEDGQY